MAPIDRARPLTGAPADYDPLLERASESHLVLLGEASHGTHEFYRERAEITKRLITEQGVTAVAVEADWPDAYRVNLFVCAASADVTAEEALRDFRRFPCWMWRNGDVLEFLGWLREWNDAPVTRSTKGWLLRARSLQPLHLDRRSPALSRSH
jgi:erythromycin esterase-like protein